MNPDIAEIPGMCSGVGWGGGKNTKLGLLFLEAGGATGCEGSLPPCTRPLGHLEQPDIIGLMSVSPERHEEERPGLPVHLRIPAPKNQTVAFKMKLLSLLTV